MWLRLRNVEDKKKKRCLSFLPLEISRPLSLLQEPQTIFSSSGTPDFLPTCLGIDSHVGHFFLSYQRRNFIKWVNKTIYLRFICKFLLWRGSLGAWLAFRNSGVQEWKRERALKDTMSLPLLSIRCE